MLKILAAPIAALALLSAAPAHARPLTLDGVWQTTITLVNCSTGTAVAPPFTSLLSFAGDGTESEATNNPILQTGQRSTAFGVWKRTGAATFHMDTYALILFSTSGPPPIKAGSQQIHQDITLSGKTWTSHATLQFFDTSGALVSSGCATASAALLD
jgi:hypothetical protein